MKRSFFALLIIFCSIFFNREYIKAETYTCVYDFTYDIGVFDWVSVDGSLEFTIDTTAKTMTYPEGLFKQPVYFFDYYIDPTFTTSYIIESLEGGCVEKIVVGVGAGKSSYIIFEESNLYRLEEANETLTGAKYHMPSKFFEEEGILDNIIEAPFGEYNPDKSTGELVEGNFGCTYYDNTLKDLKSLKCDDFDVKCNLSQKNEYNTKKDLLKSFCKNVLQVANSGVSRCITPCLSLYDEINSIEVNSNENQCGFGGRLTIWITNIIKWIKYIIPVIVIIFGILDFIKAIGADKEDEMKKAQKKFIRRLIASALIFIIPFIIEFILNKMGFIANGCGIIDL